MAKAGLDNFLKANDFENAEGKSNIWIKTIDLRKDKTDYSDDTVKNVKVPNSTKEFAISNLIKKYKKEYDFDLSNVSFPHFEFKDEAIKIKDKFSSWKDFNSRMGRGLKSEDIEKFDLFLKINKINDDESYNKFFTDLYNQFKETAEKENEQKWREEYGEESFHAKRRKRFGDLNKDRNYETDYLADSLTKYENDQRYRIKLQLICAESDWNDPKATELNCSLKMQFGQSIFDHNQYERGMFGKLVQKTHKENNNKRSEWDKEVIAKNFVIAYSDNEEEIQKKLSDIVRNALAKKLEGEEPSKAFDLIFKTKAKADHDKKQQELNKELKGTDF